MFIRSRQQQQQEVHRLLPDKFGTNSLTLTGGFIKKLVERDVETELENRMVSVSYTGEGTCLGEE